MRLLGLLFFFPKQVSQSSHNNGISLCRRFPWVCLHKKNVTLLLRSCSSEILLHSKREERILVIPRQADLQKKTLLNSSCPDINQYSAALEADVHTAQAKWQYQKVTSGDTTLTWLCFTLSYCTDVMNLHKTLGCDPPGKINMSTSYLVIQVTLTVRRNTYF